MLCVAILLFCLLIVSLIVVYKYVGRLRDDIGERIDSMHQSPDTTNKLRALIETMTSRSITDRLESMERNLNSQLITLRDRHDTLPNTEKLETLLRDAATVSRNALAQEIASIERKVSKLTASYSPILESEHRSIVAELNSRVEAALTKLQNDDMISLKHTAVMEKLDDAFTQLQTIDKTNERVEKMHNDVLSLVKDLPNADELRTIRESVTQLDDKLVVADSGIANAGVTLTKLADNIERLSSAAKRSNDGIDSIIEKHDQLARRVTDSADAISVIKEANDEIRENQRSLHDLLVTRTDPEATRQLIEAACSTLKDDGADRTTTLAQQLSALDEKITKDVERRVSESVASQEKLYAHLNELGKRSDIDELAAKLTSLRDVLNELKSQTTNNYELAITTNREDLNKLYNRFVRELDNSEHYISVTNKLKLLSDSVTEELAKSSSRLADQLTVVYDSLRIKIQSIGDQTENFTKQLTDSFAKLNTLMTDNPKDMMQKLVEHRDAILTKISENATVIAEIRDAVRNEDKTVNQLNDGLTALLLDSKSVLQHQTDVVTRLDKLQSRLQTLQETIPSSAKFWSDVGELREMINSNGEKTNKDLSGMLEAVKTISQEVKSRMDTFATTIGESRDATIEKANSLVAMLEQLEKQIIDKVVTNVRFGDNFRNLRSALETKIQNGSATMAEQLKSCSAKLDANSAILQRLNGLSDVDFKKLTAVDNQRLLDIMNEVKAQSNVQPVLECLQATDPPVNLVQRVIDRLGKNSENVESVLARLDRIAETVTSQTVAKSSTNENLVEQLADRLKQDVNYTSINEKLESILAIINDYSISNTVEDGDVSELPGLKREFIDLRKNMKRGFEDMAASVEAKKLELRQKLEHWGLQTKDGINQLRELLTTPNPTGTEENDIEKHDVSKAIDSVVIRLSDKLAACQTSLADAITRSDTSKDLKLVADTLSEIDGSVKRIEVINTDANASIRRIEMRLSDALSTAKIDELIASMSQHQTDIKDALSRTNIDSTKSEMDQLLVSHAAELTKLLDEVKENLGASESGTVGRLVAVTDRLRRAIKKGVDTPAAANNESLVKQLQATETRITQSIDALLNALVASAADLSKRMPIDRVEKLIADVEFLRKRSEAA